MPSTTTLAQALDDVSVDKDVHAVARRCGCTAPTKAQALVPPGPSDFRPLSSLHDLADTVVGVWRDGLHHVDSPERGTMRVSLVRSPRAGHWSGRVAHLLDRRILANLARR